MQGVLERVPQRLGMSWRYRKIVEEKKSYGWHRHNEYEIAIHRHFKAFALLGIIKVKLGITIWLW
ncbi:transcriptional regulator, araC family [Vibrio ishigakensis]|uniref:Transcriptional regulator, araC family n=1 Tax=Vibrio ishigakensis TaxID=1481914 RepID=A0A0B8P4H5_9VIBR|nr:transcriptional regulator, araC family [Vibrio ishigakensis]